MRVGMWAAAHVCGVRGNRMTAKSAKNDREERVQSRHQYTHKSWTEAWESISPTQGATPERGSPYPQLKGPHQSVVVHSPNSRGHTGAWESISPNSRGHTKVWESISPTRGATVKHGTPYPQLKGRNWSAGVHIPNSRGHTETWVPTSPTRRAKLKHGTPYDPTQRATRKRGSPYPQLEGPH